MEASCEVQIEDQVRVLLVGNYPPDGQESMQRFASAMLAGLRQCGITVQLIRPASVLGRFGRSSQVGLGKWLGYIDKLILFPQRLRQALREMRAAAGKSAAVVVHICDHSNSFYVDHLPGIPHVVTCHDLLAVRSALGEIAANPTRWSGRRLQDMILRGLRGAQHVACVSSATESDLLRISQRSPGQVSVIANSLNYDYSPMPEAEARAAVETLLRQTLAMDPGQDFILHVGGNQWYKNRPGVLRAYARLIEHDDHSTNLVLVGEPLTDEMKAFIHARELEGRVLHLSSCSNQDLRALYSCAGALLFPSLAEGFGWPVIEAQACGCPVVCSDAGPLPEVAGSGACLVPPDDEAGFAEALRRLISEPVFRGELIERGFANAARFEPAAMIESYLECYSLLAKAPFQEAHRQRAAAAPVAV